MNQDITSYVLESAKQWVEHTKEELSKEYDGKIEFESCVSMGKSRYSFNMQIFAYLKLKINKLKIKIKCDNKTIDDIRKYIDENLPYWEKGFTNKTKYQKSMLKNNIKKKINSGAVNTNKYINIFTMGLINDEELTAFKNGLILNVSHLNDPKSILVMDARLSLPGGISKDTIFDIFDIEQSYVYGKLCYFPKINKVFSYDYLYSSTGKNKFIIRPLKAREGKLVAWMDDKDRSQLYINKNLYHQFVINCKKKFIKLLGKSQK